MIDSHELNKIFVEFIKDIQFMEDIYFKDILSFDGNVYSDKLQTCPI